MKINIHTPSGLIPISPEVTKQTIIEALGYNPADQAAYDSIDATDDTTFYIIDSQQHILAKVDADGLHAAIMTVNGKDVESGLIYDIKELDDSAFYIVDKDQNVICRIDENGLTTTNISAIDAVLSGYSVVEHIEDEVIHVTAEDRERWDNKSDFESITEDDNSALSIVDKDGNVIAKFNGEGLTAGAITIQQGEEVFSVLDHITDADIHLQEGERDSWNAKVDSSTLNTELGKKADKSAFDNHVADKDVHLGDEITVEDNTALHVADSEGAIIMSVTGDGVYAGDLFMGSDHKHVATEDYVNSKITGLFEFKGGISSNKEVPAVHEVGDAYRIKVAGTYAGNECEMGDMLVCIANGEVANNADWTVMQLNWSAIDGNSDLTWGSSVTLASIGGIDINAKLPEKPSYVTPNDGVLTLKVGSTSKTFSANQGTNETFEVTQSDLDIADITTIRSNANAVSTKANQSDLTNHINDKTVHLGDDIKLDDDSTLYVIDKDGAIIAKFAAGGFDAKVIRQDHDVVASKVIIDAEAEEPYIAEDGTLHLMLQTELYVLPQATDSALGGIKIGYVQNDKNYPVQLSNGKAYVNVPWEDTKNEGTITGIKMNGESKGTSGVVDLGTVITNVDDKADKSSLAKVATSGSYNDLSDKPTIPSAVTESTVAGWGFTKNTGTYSKPDGGIPKSDLASDVQTSLGKADSALQEETYKGTVKSITAGKGLTGGTIAESGTIAFDEVNYKLPTYAEWEAVTGVTGGVVGTVSSVDLEMPSEFTVTGGPITKTGTFKVSLDTDRYIPTVTDKENWNKAEANVQSDWNEATTTSGAYIKNKPTKLSDFTNDLNISSTITANAEDDDVIILTGTNGTNSVSYKAEHAKKGLVYTSSNETLSIGSGTTKFKIPQLTVDTYGHVTAASDEEVSITIPSAINGDKGDSVTAATAGTSTDSNGYTITPITFTVGDTDLPAINVKSKHGADGKSISSVTKKSGSEAAGTTDVYSVKVDTTEVGTFNVYQGADGREITSITSNATEADGYTSTKVTVKFNEGADAEFTVNAKNGSDATVPSNNITGSGTNGYLAKFTGTNTIGNGIALSDIATTSDLNDYLPLTGGTLSGSLTIEGDYYLSTPSLYTDCIQTNNGELSIADKNDKIIFSANAHGLTTTTLSADKIQISGGTDDFVLLAGGGYTPLNEITAGLATENYVINKIAEAELAGGDVDLSGLATKDDLKRYLPLTGGTLTGALDLSHTSIKFDDSQSGEIGFFKLETMCFDVSGYTILKLNHVCSEIGDLTAKTLKVKNGTNDLVLLAGGGLMSLSDIQPNVDLSGYLPLSGGTMTGDITMSNRASIIFEDSSNCSIAINSLYRLQLSCNSDYLVMGHGTVFSNANIEAAKFINSTSSDSYVLLGGGGTKLLSEITAGYATEDDLTAYLPLTGGTLTGAIIMGSGGPNILFEEGGSIYSNGLVCVAGNILIEGNAQAIAFYETSDIRKKDIKSDLSLDKCYDLIDKCQTVIYSLKDQTKEQVGMIALEIEEFFPEVVATDEDGFKSLAYDRLVVICFKVLKDVIKRLEKLEQ